MAKQKSLLLKMIIASGCMAAATLSAPASAANWSDTQISWAYGTRFSEPFNPNENAIHKNQIGLTHISGYKYGTNFFDATMKLSDNNHGDTAPGSTSGAQEVYVVYRHTLDLGAVSGADMKFGPVKSVGLTAGFDMNTKNNAYASKKRMFVIGPTLMFDVPGVLNVSLQEFYESNAPDIGTPTHPAGKRYNYDPHPCLEFVWAFPFDAGIPASFEGFAQFIASKGKDEFGGPTASETLADFKLMFDVGAALGGPKGTFKLGAAYEYWKNKFGNPSNIGTEAKTPMIRAEYHF